LTSSAQYLQLEQEVTTLAQTKSCEQLDPIEGTMPINCQVDTLLQPSPAELISHLETKAYNIFFAGHGRRARRKPVLQPGMKWH